MMKSFSLLSKICSDSALLELVERFDNKQQQPPVELYTNISLIRKIQHKGTSTQLAETMQKLLF